MIFCIAVLLVIQFVENQFIYPHVVGTSVGLSSMNRVTVQMLQKAFNDSKDLSINDGMKLQAQDKDGYVFGVIIIEEFPNEKAVVSGITLDPYTLEINGMTYKEDGKVVELKDKKW